MAQQKRGKQATRGSSRAAWPIWIWLALGMLLGIALMAMIFARDWAPLLRKNNLPQPNPEASAPPPSEPALADESGKKRKSYDFYQVLPEMEVVIPDAELSAKARAEQLAHLKPGTTPAPGATPAAPSAAGAPRYVLQAGSYDDAGKADEVKAKLALLGFTAQIQPVTVNGRSWNRVRVGPYPSASELEIAKRTLAENGINAIALKETAQ